MRLYYYACVFDIFQLLTLHYVLHSMSTSTYSMLYVAILRTLRGTNKIIRTLPAVFVKARVTGDFSTLDLLLPKTEDAADQRDW